MAHCAACHRAGGIIKGVATLALCEAKLLCVIAIVEGEVVGVVIPSTRKGGVIAVSHIDGGRSKETVSEGGLATLAWVRHPTGMSIVPSNQAAPTAGIRTIERSRENAAHHR